MSVHLSTLDRAVRFAAPVALALFMSAAHASAQSRIEITRRAPGAQPVDSTERQLRRLQSQLDSLSRLGVSEDLTAAERRRIESELSRTAERMSDVMARAGDRVLYVRSGGIAPMGAARSSASMSRALMQVDEGPPGMPRGWMGIVVEGSGYLPRIENGELIVRYASYPEIVSVDPSSPAQRAGLAPRDTVVSYDGRDVREDISFTRLLRPNARVVVRIRRDGRARDIPVTIAEAPQRIVLRRDDFVRDKGSYVMLPEGPSFPRSAPMPPPSVGGGMRGASVRQPPVVHGGATPAAPPIAGSAPRPGFVFSFTTTGVAGASLTTVTPGLATALGVTTGVLVTAVPVGTPADESGLMDGDVITKVANQAVRSVAQVRQLVGMVWEEGEQAVELEIVRGKKVQKVMLKVRW